MAGGEKMIHLPPLIKYPYYDEDTEFQLFPFRTMAMAFGILSPTIASFHPPVPYVVLLGVATMGFLASLALPVPGHHLPKVTETKNSLVKIVE